MTRRDADGADESRGHSGNDRSSGIARRRFLRYASAVGGTAALAGCLGGGSDSGSNGSNNGSNGSGGNGTNGSANGVPDYIGSGPRGRTSLGGTSMKQLPAMSGTLQIYSGRGEALVGELVEYIQNLYPDLTLEVRYQGSTELANQLITEGQNSPADVFYSVNAGSLGFLTDKGRTRKLPKSVLSMVPNQFHDPQGNWVGTSGRARSIPYNTNTFSDSEIPNDIFAFPKQRKFEGVMGWAPTYGSFQAFVTAMRILAGRKRTKQWLSGMQQQNIQSYSDEFLIAQAVADGEIKAGFTNHYYIQRVLASRPDAPLATDFTRNDAGSVFNVAGAAVLDTAENSDLAANFVRHLLSSEAQYYFARVTKEYPLVPEVAPIGALPRINELKPPKDLDLTQLSNLEPTIELMREVGLDV